jgi:hypothetical protein
VLAAQGLLGISASPASLGLLCFPELLSAEEYVQLDNIKEHQIIVVKLV